VLPLRAKPASWVSETAAGLIPVVLTGCSPAVSSSSSLADAHCGSAGKSVSPLKSSSSPFEHSGCGGMSTKLAPVTAPPAESPSGTRELRRVPGRRYRRRGEICEDEWESEEGGEPERSRARTNTVTVQHPLPPPYPSDQ
jgi:hypothetical protein